MSNIQTISLKGHIPSGASIEFLGADILTMRYTSLIRVWYACNGVKQDGCLRLNADKQVFLDHFEDTQTEAFCEKAAPKIVEYLGNILLPPSPTD